MKNLKKTIQQNKQIRVLGIDDAPFDKNKDKRVNIVGVICSNTTFEGMLWGDAQVDGLDATDAIITMIQQSKFYPQLHIILLDGIALGGFNIIDIKRLSSELKIPCVAVMRRMPNLLAVDNALKNLNNYKLRKDLIINAGIIHQIDDFVFQVSGCSSESTVSALKILTHSGKVPEALRLSHLIGSAVKTGESSNRA